MSPSGGGQDIDLQFNPASILEGFRRIDKARADMEKGVAGAAEEFNKVFTHVSEQIVDVADRAKRAQDSYVRSIERQAEAYGKSNVERMIAQRDAAIKKLGNEEEAVKKVTAAYQKMIDVEQKRGAEQQAGAMFNQMRALFTGQMGMGGMMGATGGGGASGIGGMLSGMSGATAVIGGITGAFVGMEAAGYAAAKSLGAYARDVHDVEIKTGMSAVEVQKLQFAAKATGTDIGIMDRLMRGLTNAIEGTDTKSEKAREMLRGMGVDLEALAQGTASPLAVLQQLSTAIERQPNMWARNKEAMDLFNRAGIQSLPMLTELNRVMNETQGMHFMTEEDVKKYHDLNIELTKMESELEHVKLLLYGLAAKPFTITLNFVSNRLTELSEGIAGIEAIYNAFKTGDFSKLHGDKTPEILAGSKFGQQMKAGPAVPGEAYQFRAPQIYAAGMGQTSIEAAEKELESRKQAMEAAYQHAREGEKGAIDEINKTTAAYEKQKTVVEALRKAETDQKQAANRLESERRSIIEDLAKLQEDVRDKTQHPFELPAEAQLRKYKETIAGYTGMSETERNRAVADYAKNIQPLIDQQQQAQTDSITRRFQEQAENFARQRLQTTMGGIQAPEIRELGQRGVTRADVEEDITRAYQQRLDLVKQTHDLEIDLINKRKVDSRDVKQIGQQIYDRNAADEAQQIENQKAQQERDKQDAAVARKQHDMDIDHATQMSKLQLQAHEEDVRHSADLEMRRVQMGFKGDNPAAGIMEAYRIQTQLNQELYNDELKRIQLEESGWEAEKDTALAVREIHKQDAAAREEAELKIAEMTKGQMDSIKNAAEPLFHTLLTKPGQFPKQLESTVREAMLRPVTSGLSEMTAGMLHPLIFGATGTGGIAGMMHGMFGGGGKLNDVKLTAEGSVPVHVTGISAAGGAAAPVSTFSMGGFGGGFGGGGMMPAGTSIFGIPNFGGRGGGAGFGGGFTGTGGGIASLFGAAPAVGTAALPLTPTPLFGTGTLLPSFGTGGGGANVSAAQLGGGYFSGSGGFGNQFGGSGILRSILGTFHGAGSAAGVSNDNWGIGSETADVDTQGLPVSSTAQPIPGLNMSWQNKLKGAFGDNSLFQASTWQGGIASKGSAGIMGAVGMPLAMAGLTGQRRGTGGGIAESTLGGAMTGASIGFMFGGPMGMAIGAGVGAAAGALAGGMEMLAGVESPRNKAIHLVKSTYGININNSTADQIVDIANKSYAQNVSLAVRSPEVRHMLGLYAAGTGQANQFKAGSMDAHGASLVEQGGQLYQQATYQYGQAYTQSSSLPVYGGVSSTTLGNPGGNMPLSLSLNVGGQDAAKFMAGQVVTPDVIQTQYASAMSSSQGRIGQALMLSEPGAISGGVTA